MIKLYCDGACSGNPGPGGYGVVAVLDDKVVFKLSDYCSETTNNRMEIAAVVYGLRKLMKYVESTRTRVEVVTDSQYVVNTMTKNWARNKNVDLWDLLSSVVARFQSVTWTWVKGHASNCYNNIADQLAVAAYTQKLEESYFSLEDGNLLNDYNNEPVGTANTNEIYVSFVTHKEFTWNGKRIRIFTKNIFDPITNSYVAQYMGAVNDMLVLNGSYLTHPELAVVQNNCIYYAEKVVKE